MNLSKKQVNQLEIFQRELLEKNQKINLFSRKNPERQISFLLRQSLLTGKALSGFLCQTKDPVLDIGSGNGFPGLFMALLYPESRFCLCERNTKKAEFLKYILYQSRICNVEVFCQRAEDFKKAFALILSQAALPHLKMLKLLKKILALHGHAFLWISPSDEKNWSKTKSFFVEKFLSYSLESKDHLLLKVTKRF